MVWRGVASHLFEKLVACFLPFVTHSPTVHTSSPSLSLHNLWDVPYVLSAARLHKSIAARRLAT